MFKKMCEFVLVKGIDLCIALVDKHCPEGDEDVKEIHELYDDLFSE